MADQQTFDTVALESSQQSQAQTQQSSTAVNPGTQETDQLYYEENTGTSSGTLNSVLEGDELRKALIERLEHVLSKEYLASDPLLVSRLSADFYAPISVIEELPIIRSLTTDSKLINSALRASKSLVVDESRQSVRQQTNQFNQRNTIILRDIPENTSDQDVRALLQGTTFESAIVEIKPDFGKTYFIKFSTEEVVPDAFTHIRKQTLGGKPVQARIKSEPLLKSLYYGSNFVQNTSTSNQYYQSNGSRLFGAPTQGARNNGGRNFKSQTDGTYRPPFDPSKPARPPQWSTNRKKDYRGKPFDGKGRGRSGNSRHPKKGGNYPHDRRSAPLPMAASHWPPLSSDETSDATYNQASAPPAGLYTGQPDAQPTPPPTSEIPSSNSPPSKPSELASKPEVSQQNLQNSSPNPTVPAPVATAWAVSNSAVKQPPPKRPNPAPKKYKQQKQQTPSQPQQSQSSNQNQSQNTLSNNGGKWKEAKGRRNKGGKQFKQGGNNRNQSNSNPSNPNPIPAPVPSVATPTTPTTTNTATNTATNVSPPSPSPSPSPAPPLTPAVIDSKPDTSGATIGDSSPASSTPSSHKLATTPSYADVVRPTTVPTTPPSD